jgi:hypothetical protein
VGCRGLTPMEWCRKRFGGYLGRSCWLVSFQVELNSRLIRLSRVTNSQACPTQHPWTNPHGCWLVPWKGKPACRSGGWGWRPVFHQPQLLFPSDGSCWPVTGQPNLVDRKARCGTGVARLRESWFRERGPEPCFATRAHLWFTSRNSCSPFTEVLVPRGPGAKEGSNRPARKFF